MAEDEDEAQGVGQRLSSLYTSTFSCNTSLRAQRSGSHHVSRAIDDGDISSKRTLLPRTKPCGVPE